MKEGVCAREQEILCIRKHRERVREHAHEYVRVRSRTGGREGERAREKASTHDEGQKYPTNREKERESRRKHTCMLKFSGLWTPLK